MKPLVWISLGLSVLSLAIGIAIEDQWIWLIPLAGNTLVGVAFNGRRMRSVWFFGQALIAALSGAPPVPALLGLAFALASWDLAAFVNLIDSMDQTFNLAVFERSHQLSLVLAIIGGCVLALAAFGLDLRLNFLAAVLITLLALAGIVYLAGRARSEPS